jgi:hypothetical protein
MFWLFPHGCHIHALIVLLFFNGKKRNQQVVL